eukprot:6490894-Amphidinium_carterae.2
MEAIPENVSHEEMVSAVISDLIEHKLLTIHALVVNEDSKEKEVQTVTSDIILQDFDVDADGVDSEKLKRAMQKEMDNLRENSIWVISERPGPDGNSDLKARFVARGFSQFIEDPDLIYAATPHMSTLKLLLTQMVEDHSHRHSSCVLECMCGCVRGRSCQASKGILQQSKELVKSVETQRGTLWTQELTQALAKASCQSHGGSVQDESVEVRCVRVQEHLRLNVHPQLC